MFGMSAYPRAPSLGRIKTKTLYKCSHCNQKASKNLAKSGNGFCIHCGFPLGAFEQFYNSLFGIPEKIIAKHKTNGYVVDDCPARKIDMQLKSALAERYKDEV